MQEKVSTKTVIPHYIVTECAYSSVDQFPSQYDLDL